jgi:competence protein ComEC
VRSRNPGRQPNQGGLTVGADAQTEEMRELVDSVADVGCDVYKVAHDGSANVDPAFVTGTHARLAVISVAATTTTATPRPAH